jgi:hypothetical protein
MASTCLQLEVQHNMLQMENQHTMCCNQGPLNGDHIPQDQAHLQKLYRTTLKASMICGIVHTTEEANTGSAQAGPPASDA